MAKNSGLEQTTAASSFLSPLCELTNKEQLQVALLSTDRGSMFTLKGKPFGRTHKALILSSSNGSSSRFPGQLRSAVCNLQLPDHRLHKINSQIRVLIKAHWLDHCKVSHSNRLYILGSTLDSKWKVGGHNLRTYRKNIAVSHGWQFPCYFVLGRILTSLKLYLPQITLRFFVVVLILDTSIYK